MVSFLTSDQKDRHNEFKHFVKEYVEPSATQWDISEGIPTSIIKQIGDQGYFGCCIPEEHGGIGADFVTFGLLNEAFGRGSSSLTDLFTVQAMVSLSLMKWGTKEQCSRFLEPMARGLIIGAFALTEPNAGSDISGIETTFSNHGSDLVLNGAKRWISYGEIADVFLVFGKLDGKSLAALIPANSPGIMVKPIKGMMGFRSAHLAQINFDQVVVAPENIIGKPGFALSYIAPVGLQFGRISTACSSLGLLRACFEDSIIYSSNRSIAGKKIGEIGMIQSMLASMGADLQAAGLMCYDACRSEDEHFPESFEKALSAKYFSSRAVVKAASDAVQIQGAAGCNEDSRVARYYRDAKVMEIIEGTTQIHEGILSQTFLDKAHLILP